MRWPSWDHVISGGSYLVKSKGLPIWICHLRSLNFSKCLKPPKMTPIKISQLFLETLKNVNITTWMSKFVDEKNSKFRKQTWQNMAGMETKFKVPWNVKPNWEESSDFIIVEKFVDFTQIVNLHTPSWMFFSLHVSHKSCFYSVE